MPNIFRYTLLFVLALVFASPALAGPKPSEIAPYIKASAPLGKGSLTRLWFKGYDATLWSDTARWSMDTTYALSLRYGMDFTREELVETSIEEIQRIYDLPEDTLTDYAKQLAAILPNVQKDDVITALFLPSEGALFFYNGRQIGSITELIFAKQFLGIWLSPHTSEPALRNALLGNNGR